VTVTDPLGPSPHVVRVLSDRLVESGWRPSDSVILAAAGTSDPHAHRDLAMTAALLSAAIGVRVELAYAAAGEPRVADAGADVVTNPLGTHPVSPPDRGRRDFGF
jgi:sirohydrochlorin ferrochelatase